MKMATKDRKTRKQRGSRSCGGGHHNKNRGAGNRGGKGNAGGHKGKWTWIIKYDPDHFGRSGFDLPAAIKHVYNSVNVGDIDENIGRLLKEGVAEEVKGRISIDVTKLNCEKVLGGGRASKPLTVKAHSFSKSAVKKIEASGGKVIVIGAE
ncbi:MAG: uL15 family ribosomal protein [Candidatus Hydrothermarchaeaceae archaeon]